MAIVYELKALREKRATIRAELGKLGDKIKAEGRPMDAGEREQFAKLEKDFKETSESIRQAETDLKAVDSILSQTDGDGPAGDAGRTPPGKNDVRHAPNAKPAKRRVDVTDQQRALALQAWCRAQYGLGLKREHREACQALRVNPRAKYFTVRLGQRPPQHREQRDNGVGTGSTGGYLVAQDFASTFERSLKSFANVRTVADVFRTDTGAAMPYPTVDDTGNTGEQLSENTAGTQQDVAIGSVTFNAYKYGSKPMLLSFELMNDSAFNLDELIGSLAGERIGRIQGSKFTAGTGTNEPQGVVTGAAAGVTAASATAIAVDDVVKLYHSVDPAYRVGPGFGFMCNDSILAALALMKDSQGRPLFVASYRDGVPDMVYGKSVYPNQFMQATIATGTVTLLCGDYSKYKVRDVGELRLRKLEERYAEKDQVGFLGFLRSDGRYTNTNAVKKLTQA